MSYSNSTACVTCIAAKEISTSKHSPSAFSGILYVFQKAEYSTRYSKFEFKLATDLTIATLEPKYPSLVALFGYLKIVFCT